MGSAAELTRVTRYGVVRYSIWNRTPVQSCLTLPGPKTEVFVSLPVFLNGKTKGRENFPAFLALGNAHSTPRAVEARPCFRAEARAPSSSVYLQQKALEQLALELLMVCRLAGLTWPPGHRRFQ